MERQADHFLFDRLAKGDVNRSRGDAMLNDAIIDQFLEAFAFAQGRHTTVSCTRLCKASEPDQDFAFGFRFLEPIGGALYRKILIIFNPSKLRPVRPSNH
jgi:hypothetical protein